VSTIFSTGLRQTWPLYFGGGLFCTENVLESFGSRRINRPKERPVAVAETSTVGRVGTIWTCRSMAEEST
jgi:hypothetical protein